MSRDDLATWMNKGIERWGFPVVIALAFMYILRVDVLVPLVDEHRLFLRELSNSQQEISSAMREQTRLIQMIGRVPWAGLHATTEDDSTSQEN